MSPVTPPGQTRRRVFRFMKERLREGQPPTVREVQDAFGFKSVQSAREHLEHLVNEGKLVKVAGVSRGYRLPPDEAVGILSRMIPVLGQVQAGALTTAVEDPEGGYIGIHPRPGDEEMFALKVEGESMMNAGILSGDIVVVRKQATADSGDIVVALVGDEATVKRLHFGEGRVELRPENPAFKPIIPLPEELILLGKVVEVRRSL